MSLGIPIRMNRRQLLLGVGAAAVAGPAIAEAIGGVAAGTGVPPILTAGEAVMPIAVVDNLRGRWERFALDGGDRALEAGRTYSFVLDVPNQQVAIVEDDVRLAS